MMNPNEHDRESLSKREQTKPVDQQKSLTPKFRGLTGSVTSALLTAAAIALSACASHTTPPSGQRIIPIDRRMQGYWQIESPLDAEAEQAGVPDVLDFETIPGAGNGSATHNFGFCGRYALTTGTFEVGTGTLITNVPWSTEDNQLFRAVITRVDEGEMVLRIGDQEFRYFKLQTEHHFADFERRGGGLCAYQGNGAPRFRLPGRHYPHAAGPRGVEPGSGPRAGLGHGPVVGAPTRAPGPLAGRPGFNGAPPVGPNAGPRGAAPQSGPFAPDAPGRISPPRGGDGRDGAEAVPGAQRPRVQPQYQGQPRPQRAAPERTAPARDNERGGGEESGPFQDENLGSARDGAVHPRNR